MVAANDMEIIRIRAVTRPKPGKRDVCIELIRRMQDIAKPHSRDYQFYIDPENGDLINWESFDSVAALLYHSERMPKFDYLKNADVIRYEIYVRDDPTIREALADHFKGWLGYELFNPV